MLLNRKAMNNKKAWCVQQKLDYQIFAFPKKKKKVD